MRGQPCCLAGIRRAMHARARPTKEKDAVRIALWRRRQTIATVPSALSTWWTPRRSAIAFKDSVRVAA